MFISRDYLHLKLWDLRKEDKPIQIFNVHDPIRTKLCLLYENECIFDKFTCTSDSTGQYLLSGSYNNLFKVFDRHNKTDVMFEATNSHQLLRPKKIICSQKTKKNEFNVEHLNFKKKILQADWNVTENVVAVAAVNNLFFFRSKT